MDFLRSVFTRKQIGVLISAGASLILGFILVAIGVKATGSLKDQQFSKRWCDDNSYAQVSAYFSELAGFNTDKVAEIEYKIENKLTADSLSPTNENARMSVFAYSANGMVTVENSINSIEVKAIGVGGDYFMFHPLDLLEGVFFSGDDYMKDLVVLDENTAWALYGSNDIVGQYVEIGGKRHMICGVVKKDTGRLNDLAGNAEPIIYLSYSSLSENGDISYINTFEALLPNPLTDYARTVVSDNMPVASSRVEIIENSGRFKWTKLVKNVSNFGIRGMNGKGIIYPYWENIARGYEDYLTPVAILGCILFVYPMVILFFLLIRMWRKRTIHKEDVKEFVERLIEKMRERKSKRGKKGDLYE